MSKAVVISAYPGLGKTYATRKMKKLYPDLVVLDSDSSFFSWNYDSEGNKLDERNPNFPRNYIDYIKSHLQYADFIFCSSHANVRELLNREGIEHTIIIPSTSDESKEELKKRMIKRGSSPNFVYEQMACLESRIKEINDTEPSGRVITIPVNRISVFDVIEDIGWI